MPAPAVIPAPIVYFKVVAVKTLVVNLRRSVLCSRWLHYTLSSHYFGVVCSPTKVSSQCLGFDSLGGDLSSFQVEEMDTI